MIDFGRTTGTCEQRAFSYRCSSREDPRCKSNVMQVVHRYDQMLITAGRMRQQTKMMAAGETKLQTCYLILCVTIAVLSLIILNHVNLVSAQYDEGGGGGGGGGGGYYDNGAMGEDRPRVHLGIRLRIPAIKFELPRFSLPKITVSAKIRQPDRPRTITLPEINLDTSSKVAPPGGEHPIQQQDHDQYRYQSSASQFTGAQHSASSPSYGGNQAGEYQHKTLVAGSSSYGAGNNQDTTLTFSTDDQQQQQYPRMQYPYAGHSQRVNYGSSSSSAGNVYGGGGQRNQYFVRGARGGYGPQQQMWPVVAKGSAYGATNIHPTYAISTSDPPTNGNTKLWPGVANYQYQQQPTQYQVVNSPLEDDNSVVNFNEQFESNNNSSGSSTTATHNQPKSDHFGSRVARQRRENYPLAASNQQSYNNNNNQRFRS